MVFLPFFNCYITPRPCKKTGGGTKNMENGDSANNNCQNPWNNPKEPGKEIRGTEGLGKDWN